MKRKIKKSSNKGIKRHLMITTLVGVVFWLIGELLFPLLTEKMWTPIGIALYFLIFAVLMLITFFSFLVFKADVSKKENKRNIKEGYVIGAIIMVIVVVFSCFFEFLYELGGHDTFAPTSYIFMVDDSGSMQGTEDIRVEAIKEVMSNSDTNKPYAVYKFSDYAEQIKPMGLYDDSDAQDLVFDSEGGTEILSSIRTVVDDLKNGSLVDFGNAPKILLVSDGDSSSFGLKSVSRICSNNGISVSTIGVDDCDETFLKQIADSTGGVFVSCNDVAKLSESLEQAKAMNTDRNILSTRFVYHNDGLYAFLRIAFLGLLGVAWSIAKMYLSYDSKENLKESLIFSIVCCTVAAFILEFLSGSFINIRFIRLIFCVLWALTYGEVSPRVKGTSAKYGEATSAQGQPFGGNGDGKEDRLQSDNEKDDSVKILGFEGMEDKDGTSTIPFPNPLGGGTGMPIGNSNSLFPQNPFVDGSIMSDSNSNGGFTQNPFDGNLSSSSPFGNGGSNPFVGNSSSSNPFG